MNVNHLSVILAQAAASTNATSAGGETVPNQKAQMIQTVVMFVIMGFVFYFLLIRPQSKKAKQQATMLSTLRSGDKILTSSGIVGIVVAVKDRTVSIRSAETKIEVLKSAVTDITERGSEGASAE